MPTFAPKTQEKAQETPSKSWWKAWKLWTKCFFLLSFVAASTVLLSEKLKQDYATLKKTYEMHLEGCRRRRLTTAVMVDRTCRNSSARLSLLLSDHTPILAIGDASRRNISARLSLLFVRPHPYSSNAIGDASRLRHRRPLQTTFRTAVVRFPRFTFQRLLLL